MVTLERETLAGYTFANWTISPNTVITDQGTSTFTMPASHVTVTANWNLNSYTATFNHTYSGKIETKQVEYNNPVVRPADPTRDEATFIGWFSDAGFQTPYNFGSG